MFWDVTYILNPRVTRVLFPSESSFFPDVRKHARRGATGGNTVREGTDPWSGGRFVLRTLEGSAFHEHDARAAAARRGAAIARSGSFPTTPPEERQERQARWMRWPKYEPVKVAHWSGMACAATVVFTHTHTHTHTHVCARCGRLTRHRRRCRRYVRAYVTRTRTRATRVHMFSYLRTLGELVLSPAGTARRGAARRWWGEGKTGAQLPTDY